MKWNFSFMVILTVTVSACSMDANLSELKKAPRSVVYENPYNRKEPDFVSGETVTSSNNYVAVGVFGEISEVRTTSNGYQFEGSFYAH